MPSSKLRPSFWDHDSCIPLSKDVAPTSIFERHKDYLVFDIETQQAIAPGAGYREFAQMKVSVACAWDSKEGKMLTFFEDELPKLIRLMKDRLVVGYNIRGFDIPVLTGYGLDAENLDVFDLIDEVRRGTGNYCKLEYLAQGTLGEGKSSDGLQAVRWFAEGKMKEIAEYCAVDVEITYKIFKHGLERRFLAIQKPEQPRIEFSTDWT
jgi:DEAD/DEAH box helicase domain-containing protein